MTDVKSLDDGTLVNMALSTIAEAAVDANEEGRALLYSDLHLADQAVTELGRRLIETQERYDDSLKSLGVFVQRVGIDKVIGLLQAIEAQEEEG